MIRVRDAARLVALKDSLGAMRFALLLRVNRVDLAHVRDGDSLVVPSEFDPAALSPFPAAVRAADSLRKLLVVSARVQAFAVYDSGRLVRWGPTSTGREEKPTTPGLYRTNWKQRARTSTFNDEWRLEWYVNLDSRLGISLHQYELPGRPASHSCVRLLEEDAQWLYDWAEGWSLSPDGRTVLRPGSPVIVMDAFAFGQPRPWRLLPADPQATDVSATEITAAIARLLGTAGASVAHHDSTSYTAAPARAATVSDS
jgi:L,D-transpeptidase catalytic domain